MTARVSRGWRKADGDPDPVVARIQRRKDVRAYKRPLRKTAPAADPVTLTGCFANRQLRHLLGHDPGAARCLPPGGFLREGLCVQVKKGPRACNDSICAIGGICWTGS